MPVSCVIPFYNESQRLGAIVNIVVSCCLIDEVILIDDGSTDGGYLNSSSKVRAHKFTDNRGKAEAMRFGFNHASGDVIIFIDADLKGLNHSHIHQLLQPLLSGQSDMTVSMREHISFFDVVSGERAIRKETWRNFFNSSRCQRNAMEIAMNSYAFSQRLRVMWVRWPDVSQTYKSQKVSWFRGVRKDIGNVIDWIYQLGLFNFGCTYLLSWLTVIGANSWLTEKYHSVYTSMYASRPEEF